MIKTIEISSIQESKMTKNWETYSHTHVHICSFAVLEVIIYFRFVNKKNNTIKNETIN